MTQDINYFLSISSAILNYQPKNSYQFTQDMNYFLSISSAILNYQPIGQMINYLTVNNANILFNANVTISSSIGSFNQYIINNNLKIK